MLGRPPDTTAHLYSWVGCRSIGASTVPRSGSRCPCTTAWYRLSTSRALNARLSALYAISLLATTINPVVPTSSRCTTPCRSAAPPVAIRSPVAASPPITVGPVQPGLGWAATPTGLSTTTMSSSRYTIRRPSTGWGGWAGTAVGGGGRTTSSQAPALTLSARGRGYPSTIASPASTSAGAAARDSPNSRDTTWSSRIPWKPSGTGSARRSPSVVVTRTSLAHPRTVPPPAGQLQQDREHHATAQCRVGRVEDREDVPVVAEHADEVDHVADHEPGRAEDPVAEVAQRAAEHQTQRNRPRYRAQARRHPADPADHQQADHRKHEGVPGAQAERRPAVAGQHQVPGAAEQPYRGVPGQPRHCQVLGDQVDRQHPEPGTGENHDGASGRPYRHGRRLGHGRSLVRERSGVDDLAGTQRRSSNCLQVTQRVADGKAASRSTGIGLPHRSHQPYPPSSRRSNARSTWLTRSRMLLAREISCSRSNVLVPVSAWSSPAESVSRSRCSSVISEMVASYSSFSSSRRAASAILIFSVSAVLRTVFGAALVALASPAGACLVAVALVSACLPIVAPLAASPAAIGGACSVIWVVLSSTTGPAADAGTDGGAALAALGPTPSRSDTFDLVPVARSFPGAAVPFAGDALALAALAVAAFARGAFPRVA